MRTKLRTLLKYLYDNELMTPEDSAFVTGSFAITCIMNGDFSRFINGKSDIDLYVILDKAQNIPLKIDQKVVELWKKENINMINYSHPYGLGRNQINIKYIAKDDFAKLLSFRLIEYKSCRKTPLSKYKPEELFLTTDLTIDTYKYEEVYNPMYDCYILNFCYTPIQDGVYRFSNIHSMLLNGVFLWDGCNIGANHKQFLKELASTIYPLPRSTKTFLFSRFKKTMDWNDTDLLKYIDKLIEI